MKTIRLLVTLILCSQMFLLSAQDRTIVKPKVIDKSEVKPKVIDKTVIKPMIIDKKDLMLALPDLIVEDFQIINTGPVVNGKRQYTFRATLKNVGNIDAGNFTISAEVKAHNSSHFIRTNNFPINPIAAGESGDIQEVITVSVFYISEHPAELRLFIDSGGDQEFPNSYMDVSERNENNNYSNVLSIGGSFMPNIIGIHPDQPVNRIIIGGSESPSNQSVYITGAGFGKNTNNQYAVALIPVSGNTIHHMNIDNWTSIIYFTIPEEVDAGQYNIAIVNKSNNVVLSNQIPVSIFHEARVSWSDLIATWDLFSGAFSINIHNFGGNNTYDNNSSVSILGMSQTLEVPRVQFHVKNIGSYRYYINNFSSLPNGITLSKLSKDNVYVLPDDMLRMEAAFESGGVEAKGYFKSVVIGANWNDWGAPDVDIDQAKLGFTFVFSYVNGHLDYTLPSGYIYFTADIDAHDSGADWAMDTFMGHWDNDVRNQVKNAVEDALTTTATKQSICSSFMQAVFMMSKGLDANSTIQEIDFDNGIVVTFQ